MGGDSTIPLHGCCTDDFPTSSSAQTPAFLGDDLSSSEFDQRRMRSVYRQVLQSYHQFQTRIGTLGEAKTRILSYTPASWIENVGGMKLGDYDVPKTTMLVLVGPKCSGKSSLINRISKVFEEDKFASERAQVTYNSSVGDGTYFLQEYKIPRGSNSFCLYDTRSLSDVPSINIDMIKHWITKGIRHGEPVIRESDSSNLRDRIKCKARKNSCRLSENRMVNFFIFVVDGLSVLKSMESNGDVEKQYTQLITTTFNCPYLSFKDDKPVVVVTHGDLLSLTDRARVRTHLGELLGVPPMQQIFDISESDGPENELIIVDMLRYCLEHADKNLPLKNRTRNKVFRMSVSACVYLLVLGIAILSVYRHMYVHRASDSEHDVPVHLASNSEHEVAVDWHSIRHLCICNAQHQVGAVAVQPSQRCRRGCRNVRWLGLVAKRVSSGWISRRKKKEQLGKKMKKMVARAADFGVDLQRRYLDFVDRHLRIQSMVVSALACHRNRFEREEDVDSGDRKRRRKREKHRKKIPARRRR